MIVKKFQNTKNRMEKMQEKFNAFNNDMEETKKKKKQTVMNSTITEINILCSPWGCKSRT